MCTYATIFEKLLQMVKLSLLIRQKDTVILVTFITSYPCPDENAPR